MCEIGMCACVSCTVAIFMCAALKTYYLTTNWHVFKNYTSQHMVLSTKPPWNYHTGGRKETKSNWMVGPINFWLKVTKWPQLHIDFFILNESHNGCVDEFFEKILKRPRWIGWKGTGHNYLTAK